MKILTNDKKNETIRKIDILIRKRVIYGNGVP